MCSFFFSGKSQVPKKKENRRGKHSQKKKTKSKQKTETEAKSTATAIEIPRATATSCCFTLRIRRSVLEPFCRRRAMESLCECMDSRCRQLSQGFLSCQSLFRLARPIADPIRSDELGLDPCDSIQNKPQSETTTYTHWLVGTHRYTRTPPACCCRAVGVAAVLVLLLLLLLLLPCCFLLRGLYCQHILISLSYL